MGPTFALRKGQILELVSEFDAYAPIIGGFVACRGSDAIIIHTRIDCLRGARLFTHKGVTSRIGD